METNTTSAAPGRKHSRRDHALQSPRGGIALAHPGVRPRDDHETVSGLPEQEAVPGVCEGEGRDIDAKSVALRTEPPPWMFHIGIHRGTLTSRDAEPPKEVASLPECRTMALKAMREYAQLGCLIWYCYAVSPDGKRVTLIDGAPYS